jgi:hypothetical protein
VFSLSLVSGYVPAIVFHQLPSLLSPTIVNNHRLLINSSSSEYISPSYVG